MRLFISCIHKSMRNIWRLAISNQYAIQLPLTGTYPNNLLDRLFQKLDSLSKVLNPFA